MTLPSNLLQITRHSFNIGPYAKNVQKSCLKLLSQLEPNFEEIILRLTLSELYPTTPTSNQDHRISRHSFNIGPYGKNVQKSFLKLLTQLRPNYDEIVLKLTLFRIISDVPACRPTLPNQPTQF